MQLKLSFWFLRLANMEILIVILMSNFWGCSKEYSEECNPENPFEMQWFSEWIVDLQYCSCTISIFQAEYEGETVFWELMTDPLCQGIIENIPVYCCAGCELFVLPNYDALVKFQKKATNLKIVYSCSTPKK